MIYYISVCEWPTNEKFLSDQAILLKLESSSLAIANHALMEGASFGHAPPELVQVMKPCPHLKVFARSPDIIW
jgi:hypothetical protein